MKENRFLVVLILIGFSVFGQIKGIVVDENNKPISYVNISVENENAGTTSEENGEFSITVSADKNLIFSALGFEKRMVKASENAIIILKTKAFELEEVFIENPYNTKEVIIGNFKGAFYLPEPQVVPWILAKKINLDANNLDAKYLKNIIFYTKSEVAGASFRVRVFSVSKNDLPEDDLIIKDIILNVKKGKQKVEVDMTSFKIVIPNDGIIVGFESLFIEENRYTENVHFSNQKKVSKIDNYDPHIFYQYINTESSYTFRGSKWIKQQMNIKEWEKDSKVIAPVIIATLSN